MMRRRIVGTDLVMVQATTVTRSDLQAERKKKSPKVAILEEYTEEGTALFVEPILISSVEMRGIQGSRLATVKLVSNGDRAGQAQAGMIEARRVRPASSDEFGRQEGTR